MQTICWRLAALISAQCTAWSSVCVSHRSTLPTHACYCCCCCCCCQSTLFNCRRRRRRAMCLGLDRCTGACTAAARLDFTHRRHRSLARRYRSTRRSGWSRTGVRVYACRSAAAAKSPRARLSAGRMPTGRSVSGVTARRRP